MINNEAYRTFLMILRAPMLGFKYLKNPFVIFKVPFFSKVTIILKNNKKITIGRGEYLYYLDIFRKGYEYENGYFIKNNIKYKIKTVTVLTEQFNRMYGINIKNKNILDIGGFNGETALFFITERKANKVFVYEPVEENIKYIKENIKLNKLENNIVLYEKGVSNNNGIEIIKSSSKPGDTAFGMPGNKFSLEIPVESWNTVLERHEKDKIHLAKVDCEGGEKYLLGAENLIKLIPHWIIETHSKEIENKLTKLFKKLGYNKEIKYGTKVDTVRVCYFYK